MTTVVIATAAIAVFLLLIYLFYRSIQKTRKKLDAPENFVTEAAPIESIKAEIINMQVSLEKMRRDTILPDHRIDYLVSFRFIDGTHKTMRVDQELYDRITIAEVGEVIVQNNTVFDFIPNNEKA